ncbi:MAG: hypothetical protein HYZ27_02525 [Deltaproteobacteria bacterium]|nr:hypothetical protein [Deltaproteobacteria bacterium]
MRKACCLLLLSACARDLEGQEPRNRTLYYPMSLAVHDPPGSTDPDEQRYLYVLSSNFDLRYNAGWVSAIDLDVLVAADDPREAMIEQVGDSTALKVLSLGGALAIDSAHGMGVVPHRGEPVVSLLSVSADGRKVSCGEPPTGEDSDLTSAERRTDCDREHLLRLAEDVDYTPDASEAQLADPFAAVLLEKPPASGELYAVIGHLSAAVLFSQLSVIPMVDATSQRLLDVQSVRLGTSGVGYLAAHPDASVNYVAATSQYFGSGSRGSTLYSVDLARDEVQTFGLESVLAGFELMGMTFSPDGELAFVAVNRAPGASAGTDSVGVLDARWAIVDVTFEDAKCTDSSECDNVEECEGAVCACADSRCVATIRRPRFEVLGGFSIQGRPTELAYVERPGQQDLLAVVSFDDDAVFMLAPQDPELRAQGVPLSGALTPVARLDRVGSGPFAVRHVQRNGVHYLVIASFFSHELRVYDVSGEPADFRRVARLTSEHPK